MLNWKVHKPKKLNSSDLRMNRELFSKKNPIITIKFKQSWPENSTLIFCMQTLVFEISNAKEINWGNLMFQK